MRKSGKRPLAESLCENNGPPANKRNRVTEEDDGQPHPRHPPPVQFSTTGSRRRRRRRARQSVQFSQSQVEQSSERGQQGRKRHTSPSEEESGIEIDENDITELSLRLKKARLRPSVFFTISSFIEQTVDDVTVTVGEDGDGSDTSSTFTFILPLPTPTPGFGYRHSSHCDTNAANEEET